MHFSIPDCQELKEDSSSSSYTGYNIHINGLYHCTVRYRQLHNLHEQLKRIHDPPNVPAFPPKKFLPLSSHQLEERRCHLEKYIQIVGQTPHLANTDVFTGFLLSAQLESSGEKNKEISLEVFLMNNLKLTVTCNVNESSSQILEKICGKLSLPITYMYYFALFLINRDDDGDITILRKLQDFESPYISQKTYKDPTTLVIRKSYWDPVYDEELMGDKIALNLLYTQTLAEMERGWILCTRDTQAQLASLQARGAKKQYLEIARNLKYYGYTQFLPCTCNYPDPGTACVVSAGYKELCLRVKLDGGDTREGAFKVTRMKCWRITIHNDTEEPQLELSFEYLIAKEQLQWIRIFSDQAILMSVCLQSMVDELLLKKVGAKIKQPTIKAKNGCYNYMKRDGSNHQISVSQSSSFDCLTSPTVNTNHIISIFDKKLEEIDRQSLKHGVVQRINRVDHEMRQLEAAIRILKLKEQEMTVAASQTGGSCEVECLSLQPSLLSPFQKICEDNRKKAQKSHLTLAIQGPRVELPLYNQPSDTPIYHKNISTHALFKERLVKHLGNKRKTREANVELLAQSYSIQYEKWRMRVEEIENSVERQNTLSKYREIYEKEFPELKEEKKKKGDTLENMRAVAVIPPPLLNPEDRSRYKDTNGKVTDFPAEYKARQMSNVWTEKEKEIFKSKFLVHRKYFHLIASHLENKTVWECIQYYYLSKKEMNYRLLMRGRRISRQRLVNCFGITTVEQLENTSKMKMMISSPGVTTRNQLNQMKNQADVSAPGCDGNVNARVNKRPSLLSTTNVAGSCQSQPPSKGIRNRKRPKRKTKGGANPNGG